MDILHSRAEIALQHASHNKHLSVRCCSGLTDTRSTTSTKRNEGINDLCAGI